MEGFCFKCNKSGTIKQTTNRDGRVYNWGCLECWKKYQAEYRKNNREKIVEYQRNSKYKTKYGITLNEYNKILEFQQGGCAICRKLSNRPLVVDHDHVDNHIRGLLCNDCNLVLGYLHDDEELLWKMAEYLKKHTWNKTA